VALAYLLVGGPIGAFIHDVFYSSTHYVQMRRLPFPSLDSFWKTPIESAVYIPPVVIAVALAVAASPRRIGTLGWVISAFIALCFALYLKGWVRISVIHASGAIIVALLLLPILWKQTDGGAWRRVLVATCVSFATVPTFFALIVAVATATNNLPFVANFLLHGAASCEAPAHLRAVACIHVGAERDAVVQFVINRLPKDERLFVGTTRHDKIVANDNLMYFATQRLPATHWHHYDPGLQSRADIQNDMVLELERQAVRYIVLLSGWDNVMEPNASALSSGVTILDDYIRLHYEAVIQYGGISVLARRNHETPP
jgi:hypothetical protein